MSEAAALPIPEPLTLEELASSLISVIAAGNAEVARVARALEASPGTLSDTTAVLMANRIADRQIEARGYAQLIREAGMWRTLTQMHEARQAAASEPESSPQRPRRRGARSPDAAPVLAAVR
jgi:hypothetical protein